MIDMECIIYDNPSFLSLIIMYTKADSTVQYIAIYKVAILTRRYLQITVDTSLINSLFMLLRHAKHLSFHS